MEGMAPTLPGTRRPAGPALGIALAAIASLAVPGHLAACDTVLLELILARDQRSGFEEEVKLFSRLMLDMGKAARNGGKGLDYLRSVFTRSWSQIYQRWYLSPPPGHAGDPRWRQLMDSMSKRVEEVREKARSHAFDPLHASLRAAQDALATFYLPAPRVGQPAHELDLLRTLARGVAKVASADPPTPDDLVTSLALFRGRLAALVEHGILPRPEVAAPDRPPLAETGSTAGATRLQALADRLAAAAGPEAARPLAVELEAAVAEVRKQVLEAAWFGGAPR